MHSNDAKTESIWEGDWDEVRNKFSSVKEETENSIKSRKTE